MTTSTPGRAPRIRGLYWTVGAVAAAVTLTSSGVALKLATPNQTRVLGEQFTASTTTSGSTTAGNNGCGNGNGGASGSKDCSNPGHQIVVTGTVLGTLYPGTSTTLRLQIENSNNQDLTLQSASATVGTPNKSGCPSSWFAVTPYAGTPTVTLKKNSTTPVDLVFRMINQPYSQDSCKSASVPLSFTATAAG